MAAFGRVCGIHDFPSTTVADVTAALLRFPGDIPGTLTATCLLEVNLAAHLQLVCEGHILTLSERMLRIESGRETHEVRSTADAFFVEDMAFVEAVRTGDCSGVLCDYASALATHRVCLAIG